MCLCAVLGVTLFWFFLPFLFSLPASPHSLSPPVCRQPVSKYCLALSNPDSTSGSEVPASSQLCPSSLLLVSVAVSHASWSLVPLASCLSLEVSEGSSPPLPTLGLLHQLQLRGGGRPRASRLLRLGLRPPGASLHDPGQPGCRAGERHPHTLLHAHPKVKAGACLNWGIPRGPGRTGNPEGGV